MFFSVAAENIEDYNIGDIIKFPHTFSNVNPGFPGWNPATNMFTCPYSGYYMFIVTLYKWDGSLIYNYHAHLTMSDAGDVTGIFNYHAFSSDVEVFYSSSMSAIVPCNQGEHVWVEMRSNDVKLVDYSSAHYNQFSGLLIKEGLV